MLAITWYMVGILAAGSVYMLMQLYQKYQLNWISLAGLGMGIGMILFCIAWSVGSVLEGVPRAASMGVVCFGLPGVALLTIMARMISKKLKAEEIK